MANAIGYFVFRDNYFWFFLRYFSHFITISHEKSPLRVDFFGNLETLRMKCFLTYRKLRKIDLAVLPRPVVRKAAIGELTDAGTARFFDL